MLTQAFAALLILLSAQAPGGDALVVPAESRFTLKPETSRTGRWNFTGQCDVSGTIRATRPGSEVEVWLILGEEQGRYFPYLKPHAPPRAIQIDDYDAAENFFPKMELEALEQGKVSSLERELTVRVYHYQIWVDGDRVSQTVLTQE